MLDSYGRIKDQLSLHYLKSPVKKSSDSANDKYSEDFRKLQAFLRNNRPSLIVMDASSLLSRNLKEKILQAYSGFGSCSIEFMDPEIARIYQRSYRAKSEFPDALPCFCHAVSLGRLRLDPLAEISGICTRQSDMLSLSLHPLQSVINEKSLVRGLRRILIDVTSHVGADINLMVSLRHLDGPLQFASGLGPRKAKYIIQQILSKGLLKSRNELLEDVLGPCVYKNLAGFLRIRALMDLEGIELSVLDDSRIHPDSYFLVERIVFSLKEGKNVNQNDISQEILELRENDDFSSLDSLDLEYYAKLMEERQEGKFGDTLQDIKYEIKKPWRDRLRKSPKPLTAEQLFALFTGEILGVALRKGQVVTARAVHVSSTGVRVMLDSGLSGFISIKDLSDERPPFDMFGGSSDDVLHFINKFVQVDSLIRARIIDFVLDKFEVRLSSKKSDLDDKRRWEVDPNEDRYHRDLIRVDENLLNAAAQSLNLDSQASVNQAPKLKRFIDRSIMHPHFKNVDRDEAIDYLNSSKTKFVLRPSSAGLHNLTLTWKVADGLFCHIDIIEEDKPNDIAEALGHTLIIRGQKFESIDEIIAT
jgi:transcription elongation factor SPT6